MNNPGGSGIYGQPGNQDSSGEALDLLNKVKDREMRDFKDKSQFMSDMSIKQDRMRRHFDPMLGQAPPSENNQMNAQNPQGMNVVLGRDPNAMTGYEKGQLGIRQQGVNLNRDRLASSNRLGEEKLGVEKDKQQLAEEKNTNIRDTKMADIERKTNEANSKLELAQKALEAKTKAGEDTLQAHKDLAAAVEERHKLEMQQKDTQFNETKKMHEAQIKKMEEDAKRAENTETTTEVDASGNKKTVTTKKGDSAGTIQVTGKDGKPYMIPKDKLDDWNKNHK